MFILSSDLYNTNSFLVSDFGLDLNNFNQVKSYLPTQCHLTSQTLPFFLYEASKKSPAGDLGVTRLAHSKTKP